MKKILCYLISLGIFLGGNFMAYQYDPVNGYLDANVFPNPTTEEEHRQQANELPMQALLYINDLDIKKVSKDELTNQRKLDENGNFTGTWNGVGMTVAEPGLSSAFNAHQADNVKHITASERTAWNNKVDKVEGKGLSSNDYTNTDKAEVAKVVNKADKTYVDTLAQSLASGSPKGVYATLAELQAAFPTGTTGIYIVSADGNWYYWNGSAWTAGGTYQSSGIARNTINQEHIAFPVIKGEASKNLFDKSTAVPNVNLNTSGVEVPSEGWYVSDFIPVQPNTNYHKNTFNSAFFYDANKTFISYSTAGQYTITTPANCYYMRIAISPSDSKTIDTAQVELGTVETAYEPFGVTINTSAVKDFDTVINAKLKSAKFTDDNFNYPLYYKTIPNKNLFVKTTVTAGKYVSYTTGALNAAAGYNASDWIAVKPNTNYHKNTYDQLAFYDENKVYISGLNNNIYTFTTPSNAAYIRMTVKDADLETAQLEEGTVETTYQTGLPLIKREQIIDLPSITGISENLVIVSKHGGDYSTIMDAVNAITDSSPTKRYTILIMPGVYEEAVSIQTKYIDLVALNLGSVTIINNSGEYETPPIEMSCLNNLKNLIIIATEDEKDPEYVGEPAYAIHHDYVGEGSNYIENCKIISYSSCAIGIGTHQSQHITIKNCELIVDTASGSRPALLYHNKVTTATEQKLTVENSRLKADGYSVISIIDVNNNGYPGGTGDNRDTEVEFYNNVFWSALNGKTDVIYAPDPEITQPGCIDGYIKLSEDSFGNNVAELNAP